MEVWQSAEIYPWKVDPGITRIVAMGNLPTERDHMGAM